MKKRVLLIGSPLSESHKQHLSGVNLDIPAWMRYFSSDTGGAFLPGEVAEPKNPTVERIKDLKKWCDHSDLNIIVFSGHAVTLNDDLYIQLNDEKLIKLDYLYNKSARQIIILDTCRQRPESLYNFEGMGDIGHTFEHKFPIQARKIYDHYLKKSAHGRMVIYSSQMGEASFSTNAGSDYTLATMKFLKDWDQKGSKGLISVEQAFLNSQTYTDKRTKGKQIPEAYSDSDLHKQIPFAINVKRYIRSKQHIYVR